MIVGAYTLELYCDCCLPHERRMGGQPRGYAAPTLRECMKQARKEGWTFRKGKCRCKKCGEEGRPFPKAKVQP